MILRTLGVLLVASAALVAEPIDIGSRLEPMVDAHLIDRLENATLKLHRPVARDVVLVHDEPWEGNSSSYHNIFKDGDVYRMYYRGSHYGRAGLVACYAESRDGIHWTKPELGLVEWEGSSANNIIRKGPGAHNFAPFKDTNPDAKPEQQYKALAFMHKEVNERQTRMLYAFESPDAIHWKLMHDEPIMDQTQGQYDTLNVASWDEVRGQYVAFVRKNRRGDLPRDVGMATSDDFINWTPTVWLDYGDSEPAQMYTNGIIPYERAPHIFFGFPMRYMGERTTWVKLRGGDSVPGMQGLTDSVFMTSRDGVAFKRWDEALVPPGLQRDRWVTRNNMIAHGIIFTESEQHEGHEISIYSTEGYIQGPACRLRRHTVRVDGFVSVRAGGEAGEMLTKPIVFSGSQLRLNFATSAAGTVRVEIQDADGNPIEGFGLEDCPDIFDDRLDHVVTWEQGSDVSALAGKPIRLRFVFNDADIYALQFTD